MQLLGGTTLVAAYGLGADSIGLSWAPAALIAIGLGQLAAGLSALVRADRLRLLIKRRPGLLVGAALTPAVAVTLLGGSGLDAVWVTSAQCWLIAAGAALALRGLIAGTVLATSLAAAGWIAVEGASGGYGSDGDYLLAVLAMAKVIGVGLWLGFAAGQAARLLDRWVIVERHELGVVQQLRSALAGLDAAAGRLAVRLDQLPGLQGELRALVTRLRARETAAEHEIALGPVLQAIVDEHDAAGLHPPIALDLHAGLAAQQLSASTADPIGAAVRPQLANVVRHAPSARHITISATHAPGEQLRIAVEDDGGGTPPEHLGLGSAWSGRQLARIGAAAHYRAGRAGVAYVIEVPMAADDALSTAPDLSVRDGLDRFAERTLAALRWSSYVGDTLGAAAMPGLGARWLLMPAGAVLIEAALRWGLPGMALAAAGRRLLASALSIVLVLVFTLPADSPASLVPTSTSVVVPALLLIHRQSAAWVLVEIGRALAVLPLIGRHGTSVLELVVIYPAAFALLVLAVRGFLDRAQRLEEEALDAFGRGALARASVHGVALRHDAVDLVEREAGRTPALRGAADELDAAIRSLQSTVASTLDPRDVIRSAIAASVAVPVVEHLPSRPIRMVQSSDTGAVDRITLFELAALAADERASCAPPGVLGRRRLRSIELSWSAPSTGERILDLVAEPTLAPPDRRRVAALRRVAETVGVRVQSSPQRLRLLLPAR